MLLQQHFVQADYALKGSITQSHTDAFDLPKGTH